MAPLPQQIEHNLKFDFSMTGDDGQEMKPVFGPGLTGLRNLGNRLVPSIPCLGFGIERQLISTD
jgi:ubiquitin carboxyl-terminal hydrolase 5/13